MKLFKQILFSVFLSLFLVNCSGTKSVTAKADNQINNEKTAGTTENENSSEKKTTPDGSSIKNAIKVNSVAEEYKIAKKLCPNCTMNGQALLNEGNKHYDLLKLTNEKGEEVKYYFDINSFFGKW
ncbi:hypothetical protein [Flavobacterium pectinovorum]|uniref:hypothetical protein n=1 Tax=Flavobacterium pectinovorum TaxID=29533 RepID=UPI001FAD778C|nr:hypothetical protein [Flavobacterium pectinovorum]MCI9845356.1 hypothetical protein [Flavobacterium pectinovorum]